MSRCNSGVSQSAVSERLENGATKKKKLVVNGVRQSKKRRKLLANETCPRTRYNTENNTFTISKEDLA